ncbi:E3 ubiquitin-protein ligase RNF183-like isoform X1 [Stegostoma tigrinum]|uniref:E3 ubiquitin-protein ligase RNF183-like isoform X1 n=1 Tax=Stegostoma tigrinum TaxID=3053191 RepID=UPI00202B0D5A|nr:E3 ubiquitin-protein ligase RNF183-like isoform X1 [Stegostoma tigrinum]
MPADTECSICYCPYATGARCPRVLPCGHTFCSQCLLALLSLAEPGSSGLCQLLCPLCRRPAQACPEEDELPFPVDPALDELMLSKGGPESAVEGPRAAAKRGPKWWVKRLKRKLGLRGLRHSSTDAVCVNMRDMVLMASFHLM